MIRQSLFFTAPHTTELRDEPLAKPQKGEVLVKTLISAISPGTEMLIYRGQFPRDLKVDDTIASLAGDFGYPLKYGYSVVGRVISLGADVPALWQDRLVFAFQPHESHFVSPIDALISIPEGISPEDAVFLPNMETAVNFLMDGQPIIGERVLIFGQGIVGLLTTALLSQYPLAFLMTVDQFLRRREASFAAGAFLSVEPDAPQLTQYFQRGADLTYELSGSPAALDQAILLTGFNGRIVIGSWYGEKRADLALGGAFHRSRIKLISSQVSTLTPELSGRWTKSRRLDVAWEMLSRVTPSRFITHRFPFSQAADAYRLIDQHPDQTIQVIFTYP